MTTTTVIRPVVVGVDDSAHAMRAAMWAAAEAVERGVPLHLIHAFDDDPSSAVLATYPDHESDPGHGADSDASARSADPGVLARVAARVRAAHSSLEVACTPVPAGAPGALVAASQGACLLVVGSRGRGGFAGLPLGSVSMRVVAHTHCPTVVVRGRGHEDARTGDIVLGMEHGEAPGAVLFAFAEAQRAGVAVHAVRAWTPYPMHSQTYLSDTDILARQALNDMATELKDVRERFPEVPVKLIVERGHASAVLSDASRGARLTVVGAHRHHGPLSLGIGPIIQGLLIDAQSPVAVVPEPEA